MYKSVLLLLSTVIANASAWINLSDTVCGSRRFARIIGGTAAARAEFPWLVSLTRRGGHYCGATIVSKRWLMTAAHCICSGFDEPMRPMQIRAILGEHDLSKQEEPRSREVKVKQIIPHPKYRCGRPSDDIALLQLDEDIEWSDTIVPACLSDGAGFGDYSGRPATVAGWGWLNEISTKGGRADVLQKVDVDVMENSICQQWYQSQGKKTKISPSQMCAGDEKGGRDSCWADSGGPLMSSESGRSVVIGVVSTGIGCGRPRLPGLYTRVSEYLDWIQEQIKNN